MKDIELGLTPYFESVASLAGLLNVSTYVTEYNCRFSHCLTIRRNRVSEFMEAVKKEATDFFIADGELEEFEAHILTDNAAGQPDQRLIVIVVKGHSNFVCSIFSNVDTAHIYSFVGKHQGTFISRNADEIEVSYLYKSVAKGFASSTLYIGQEKLQPIHPELYPDIDIKALLKAYADSRESILMLYGAPGVGKTTFIKFLLAAGEFESVAYVKDPEVMNMGDMWGKLTNGDYDLVIFDDLDTGLNPRTKAGPGNNFMTQLLSFSDGIFHGNNSKIIITTNQHVGEIDGALVRPGRCFDFIQLHPLKREQALTAWTELLGLEQERFEAVFKDDKEITQASLMSEATLRSSTVSRAYVKSGDKDYTLDQKLAALNIKVTTTGREDEGGLSFGKRSPI